MSKEQFSNKIIWLASYPKSGNTWFRAFLTALLNDGEVEINNMETDGIFSSREIFAGISDIDSQDLYDEEVKRMLPDIFRGLADTRKQTAIIKVHDAFSYNSEGKAIIPEDVTHCAVYFIRNPLDVAGSLANHNNSTIDQAIRLMNNEKGTLAEQKNDRNIHSQLRQLMYDWSGHVKSWTTRPGFPVYVVRYEDMLTDTFSTFNKVVQDVGWNYSEAQVQKAINASSFDRLRNQEAERGFKEKASKVGKFFRAGKMDNWQNELTKAQASEILNKHKEIMRQYNYQTLNMLQY